MGDDDTDDDEAALAGIWIDPTPARIPMALEIEDIPGTLRFPGDHTLGVDARETRSRALLWRLAGSRCEAAVALRGSIRRLAVTTWPRLGEPLDVRPLARFTALERLLVASCTGIVGAGALGALPHLRHLTLYAYQRNEIADLDGIAANPNLETLDLLWGSLGDLRALGGLRSLRRLRVSDNQALSLRGIEGLPIETLDLWLSRRSDLSTLASLPALTSLTLRGQITRDVAAAIARCPARAIALHTWRRVPADALVALPAAPSLRLEIHSIDDAERGRRALPATELTVRYLGDAGLVRIADSPRLRELTIHNLASEDLDPLADHPTLQGLRFRGLRLRTLDHLPPVRLLTDRRDPTGPNRLVLKDAPLRSIRGIGSLRGVDHLDLRGCRELTSLAGVEGLEEVRTIDLRGCTALHDLSALAALPGLVAVLVNHQSPPGAFPPEVAGRVTRSHLHGLVRRIHALGPAASSQT